MGNMDDDFIKKRLARDMAELKKLCEEHFKQRAIDEEKVKELEERIANFKKEREVNKDIVLKPNRLKMLVWKHSKKRLWQKRLKDKLKLKPERLKFSLLWLVVMISKLQWTSAEPFDQARKTKRTRKQRPWQLWVQMVKVPLYRHNYSLYFYNKSQKNET